MRSKNTNASVDSEIILYYYMLCRHNNINLIDATRMSEMFKELEKLPEDRRDVEDYKRACYIMRKLYGTDTEKFQYITKEGN